MMKMRLAGGLRVVHGFRLVSSLGLLGPPEIHSDLKTSLQYVESPFPRPWDMSIYDFIEKPCLYVFRYCIRGPLDNRYRMDFALDKSWNKDPLTTLRVIGYMKRNTHAFKHKHARQQFYNAALWLHAHHPKTLAGNLKAFSKHGCLKDWPEVLHHLVRGPFVREADMLLRARARRAKSLRLMAKKSGKKLTVSRIESDNEYASGLLSGLGLGSKEERRIQQARQAVEMYNSDPCYRSLHDSVSDLFAELLKSDLEYLDSGEFEKISLASKWCPSLGSSYDRSTLLCESIARRLFPYHESSYRGIEEAHYAYRVRDRLRKQVLIPLRRALQLPEIYMSNNQWGLLPYDRASLTAMKTYARLFIKHDKYRFSRYITVQQQHKVKISGRGGGGTLWPHEICGLLNCGHDREALEEQWRRMVETLSREGKFKNCVVACDWSLTDCLSRHDFSLPFQLLASELSDEPWNGMFLTQTRLNVAEFVKIEGDDLEWKMQCLKARSRSSHRLCAETLVDKILETAVCGKVSREKMVKRLFVISIFVSDGVNWEEMRKKYEQCGYVMPNIVLWETGNHPLLRKFVHISSSSDDISSIQGFTPSWFRVFMEKDGKLEQDDVMQAEVPEEDYKELEVLD